MTFIAALRLFYFVVCFFFSCVIVFLLNWTSLCELCCCCCCLIWDSSRCHGGCRPLSNHSPGMICTLSGIVIKTKNKKTAQSMSRARHEHERITNKYINKLIKLIKLLWRGIAFVVDIFFLLAAHLVHWTGFTIRWRWKSHHHQTSQTFQCFELEYNENLLNFSRYS